MGERLLHVWLQSCDIVLLAVEVEPLEPGVNKLWELRIFFLAVHEELVELAVEDGPKYLDEHSRDRSIALDPGIGNLIGNRLLDKRIKRRHVIGKLRKVDFLILAILKILFLQLKISQLERLILLAVQFELLVLGVEIHASDVLEEVYLVLEVGVWLDLVFVDVALTVALVY